jgi:hypothetical protein
MFELIFAIFMAMLCPHNTNTSSNCNGGSQVTTLDDDGDGGDSGGETGHIPPKPPKP